MPIYIEYELDDGSTALVEAPEDTVGVVKAARGSATVIKAQKTFSEAIKEVNQQAKLLLKEIDALPVNEAEIKFGLTTAGEVGNIAIGKIGLGVNYEVTLRWKKPAKT